MMTPVNSKASGTNNAAGPSDNPWDTINQVVAHALGTKVQGRHISNHNLANRLFLANQKLGRDMGLPDQVLSQVTPFPSPANNTFILNENPAAMELLSGLMSAQQSRPDVSLTPQTPAPAQQPPTWKRWLWPIVAGVSLAAAGGTVVALWPDSPPAVNADYEVTAR